MGRNGGFTHGRAVTATVAPRLIEAGNPELRLIQAINVWSQAQYPGQPITTHRASAIIAALEAHGFRLAVLEPGA